MKDARLELLVVCLQDVVEKTAHSLNDLQQAAADRAFLALERAGVTSPGLGDLRERQQYWSERLFKGVLKWNREFGGLVTGRSDAARETEPGDPEDFDAGEEPADAPRLRRPTPPSRPRARPVTATPSSRAAKPAKTPGTRSKKASATGPRGRRAPAKKKS